MIPAAPPPKIVQARPVADLSWASKVARARRTYKRTWREVAHLFGAPALSAPPPVEWVNSYEANATRLEDSPRRVILDASTVSGLDHVHRDPQALAEAKTALLHEWSHVYQNRDLLANPDPNLRELAAQLFATYWGHRLWGAAPEPNFGPTPYMNRPASSTELAAAYGPDYWRHAQFTEHWGQAPASIGWP